MRRHHVRSIALRSAEEEAIAHDFLERKCAATLDLPKDELLSGLESFDDGPWAAFQRQTPATQRGSSAGQL